MNRPPMDSSPHRGFRHPEEIGRFPDVEVLAFPCFLESDATRRWFLRLGCGEWPSVLFSKAPHLDGESFDGFDQGRERPERFSGFLKRHAGGLNQFCTHLRQLGGLRRFLDSLDPLA